MLIQHKSYILVMMTLFMTSRCQNQFEYYVIATDKKSAMIHLLFDPSLRHTQLFLFLD